MQWQVPFILSQKDIEENSEAIVRALRFVNTYSTTSMWVRLKAEDYYNSIAGYFGNVVGRPTQWNDSFLPWGAETLKEAELWYLVAPCYNLLLIHLLIRISVFFVYFLFVLVRPQYGFRLNRGRYSVMECRILFWMKVGLDVFYPERNVARLPLAQNVSICPLWRRRRRFVRRRVAFRMLRREPLGAAL